MVVQNFKYGKFILALAFSYSLKKEMLKSEEILKIANIKNCFCRQQTNLILMLIKIVLVIIAST